MSETRPHPEREEYERTFHILVGMAFRKRFLTEQDREDFVQDVMLSAFRSYDADRERSLSFKNFACGPVFRRAYQSYWRRFYRSPALLPIGAEDGPTETAGPSDQAGEEPTDLLLMQVLVEEIEDLEAPLDQLMFQFLRGMTREEVARAMKKSVSWAKKYTLKALQLLIKRLKARGIIVETFALEQLLT